MDVMVMISMVKRRFLWGKFGNDQEIWSSMLVRSYWLIDEPYVNIQRE